MRVYRHYSFDLWLTLIRSNPLFKQERVGYFYAHFNPHGKTQEEVAQTFRRVDVMCNTINEHTGKDIDAAEMYLMVISMINDYVYPLHTVDLERLGHEMDQLFFAFPPEVYCPDTIDILKRVRTAVPCTMSILSNTGFIKGAALRKVLAENGLGELFDFQLYSDEEGMSKPNKLFFEQMMGRVQQLQAQILPGQVIHVGDNPNADIEGARSAGIDSLLINSNNKSIHSLLN